MPFIPDFSDPRYLNEVGWFLYREKYGYNHFGHSYTEERLVWSQMLFDEILAYCGREQEWLKDKTVVSIGGGGSVRILLRKTDGPLSLFDKDAMLQAYERLIAKDQVE